MSRFLISLLATALTFLPSTAFAQIPDEPELEAEPLELLTKSAFGPAISMLGRGPAGPTGAARRQAPGKSGRITFFANQKLPCDPAISGGSGCLQLGEPEIVSAPDGTIYATAQEGVPGGVNLWRRDPKTFEYEQLPKPDAQPVLTPATGLAYGGGDNDIAVSSDGKVYVSSLALVTAGVATSADRGETFAYNVAASGLPGVDRQWITSFGPDTVYMSYHDLALFNIWLVKSSDGGNLFGPPISMVPPEMLPQVANVAFAPGAGNVTSDLVADPDERVALVFLASADAGENFTGDKPTDVYISITQPGGANPQVHLIHESDESVWGLFPALASDQAGNLYASWTNLHGVFLSISRDHGVTWSKPRKISTGKENASTVFPFVIGGSKGRVGLSWLGASAKTPDDDEAEWQTYYSVTTNALAKKPRWRQVVASDHVIHTGSICLEGLACDLPLPMEGFGGDRNLLEVLQMGLTKDGRVLIAYPDDSETSFGWSFIAEQRTGPGLYADVRPKPPVPGQDEPGGPVEGPVRLVGTATNYLVPADDTGTPVSDAEGNVVDAPGDEGLLAETAGSEGHVASANVWTTNFGAIPLAFMGPELEEDLIVGGTMRLTTYLQEAMAEAAVGTITARLFDIAPDGTRSEIATGGSLYEAGVDVTEAKYRFKVSEPWEVLAGHRLRVELNVTCFCSTTMRFYYGSAAYQAGLALDRFVRA
ncbi:MAG: hypothetical protein ACRDH6_08845 [Actinomycetota bacterium]